MARLYSCVSLYRILVTGNLELLDKTEGSNIMPTCKEIIEEYLKNNGYDGLYSWSQCGCKVGDLMPCGEIYDDCEAGHFVKCTGEFADADFCIGPKKDDSS